MPPKASGLLPVNNKKGITIGGVLLIILLALLQALGFCGTLEQNLILGLHQIVPNLINVLPRVVLISLESTPQGFDSMDVAMSLRGLGELHPRCVIVNGLIAPEEGPVPFLPDILSQMKTLGVTVIVPEPPSPLTRYQAVPLTRYSFVSSQTKWPKIEGKAIPGAGEAFLPDDRAASGGLPLLGITADNSTIGSLWWWSLPSADRQNSFLLFEKLLLLGNNSPFHLTSVGAVNPGSSQALKEIPIDDFLLQIEQRERGTLSPAFDAIWIKATVIIGIHDDLQKASALAALLKETSYRHLSLGEQILTMLGWIAGFLLLLKYRLRCPKIPAWFIPLILVITLLSLTLIMLHLGIIIPFLPGVVVALLALGW